MQSILINLHTMKIKWWNKILLFGISGLSIITPTILSSCANNNPSDVSKPEEENKDIEPIFVPVKSDDYFICSTGNFKLHSWDEKKNGERILDKNVFNNFINKYDNDYLNGFFSDYYILYSVSYLSFKEITLWDTKSYLFYDLFFDYYDTNYRFNNDNINFNDNIFDKLDITLKIFLHNNSDKDKIYISQIECSIIINDNFRKNGYRWKLDPKIYKDAEYWSNVNFIIRIAYA